MAKLYIFGIGGTGSRVIKALTMLFAAGVKLENNFDTVIPIIIDPDIDNGDLTRTTDILKLYQQVRRQVKDPDDFYRQEIKTLRRLANPALSDDIDTFQFRLNDVDTMTFSQYIGFDTLSDDFGSAVDDKNFVRLFYSRHNLASDLRVGFKGNPNMGSIVLNQFINSEDFNLFGGPTFGENDAIFIINSIFGGTGAAGFPLLLKNLRGNRNLTRYRFINDAPIGGITYLPYFTLRDQDDNEIIAESFEDKAKIAIEYYNRTIINQRKINVLYFTGNRGNSNVQDYAVGGEEQRNNAHFLEIAGALAVIDFCRNIANYTNIGGQAVNDTVIKEFGIQRETENITFNDLSDQDGKLISRPLKKFRLYTQYLREGLKRSMNLSRWTKSNILLVPDHKQSPLDEDYFNGSPYDNHIRRFNRYFTEWVTELEGNTPAFIPFREKIPITLYKNIDLQNCLFIERADLRSDEKEHTTLVKIFGLSTDKVCEKFSSSESVGDDGGIKVFRLHRGGIINSGWFNSIPINNAQLSTITTEGTNFATSIPSPFARIDLVKSAFRWVVDNNIEGDTAQHKLVSDALDVAQLFYNYPLYRDNIMIVSWNPNDRFDIQFGTDNQPAAILHARFAETLRIFWEQDSDVYNFDIVNKLYFIINRDDNRVIGGTSPATLFFAAPDARQVLGNLRFICGNHTLFSDECCSLNRRDESFIEYLYAFSRQNGQFAFRFPEVFSYMDRVQELLEGAFRRTITNLTPISINRYPACTVLDTPESCRIIDFRMGVKGTEPEIIENGSDFVIKSDFEDFNQAWNPADKKYNASLTLPGGTVVRSRPLVLPYGEIPGAWTYTTNGIFWGDETDAPYRNDTPENTSTLPIQGDNYDWLSIGNFLEDKIIELPYRIDPVKFNTCGSQRHLLPLSPTFFKYFSSDHIHRYLTLEMREKRDNGRTLKTLAATLNIPVKRGIITFRKEYKGDDIINLDFHLALMPFLRTDHLDINYTIAVLDNPDQITGEVNIDCINMGNVRDTGNPVIRADGGRQTGGIRSSYYKNIHVFDTVIVKNRGVKGCIVPNMPEKNGNQQIDFAIDFGTTNTHIEYRTDNLAARALDNTYDIAIWQPLYDHLEDGEKITFGPDYFEKELFPYQFSEQLEYKFPFRTALATNRLRDLTRPIEAFGHANCFLLFEKRFCPDYLSLYTELKWSNYNQPEERLLVEQYIKCLMLMVLYKTLLNDGNPGQTRITWLYPVSMDTFEQGIFRQAWERSYQNIFGPGAPFANIRGIPESIAPYLEFRAMYPQLSLSIDIGGGSSDIALFDQASASPIMISSFKFAGNAIFGDGFPSPEFLKDVDNNGFAISYKDDVRKNYIKKGSQQELIFDEIHNKMQNSADFSSFLFSLEAEPGTNFSYTNMLKADRMMKLPILVFYSAIIYYSANLLKKNNTPGIPANILLSGTASKTMAIIDSTEKLSNLSKLVKFIFSRVSDLEGNKPDIKIVIAKKPKEITCKGALRNFDPPPDTPVVFWIGGTGNIWGEAINRKKDVKQIPTYGSIDENIRKEIKSSIEEFYSLLDEFLKNINIEAEFGISRNAYEIFRNMRSNSIIDYLNQGLAAFNRDDNNKIEETLFFHPLIGILNSLAFELSNNRG